MRLPHEANSQPEIESKDKLGRNIKKTQERKQKQTTIDLLEEALHHVNVQTSNWPKACLLPRKQPPAAASIREGCNYIFAAEPKNTSATWSGG